MFVVFYAVRSLSLPVKTGASSGSKTQIWGGGGEVAEHSSAKLRLTLTTVRWATNLVRGLNKKTDDEKL